MIFEAISLDGTAGLIAGRLTAFGTPYRPRPTCNLGNVGLAARPFRQLNPWPHNRTEHQLEPNVLAKTEP